MQRAGVLSFGLGIQQKREAVLFQFDFLHRLKDVDEYAGTDGRIGFGGTGDDDISGGNAGYPPGLIDLCNTVIGRGPDELFFFVWIVAERNDRGFDLNLFGFIKVNLGFIQIDEKIGIFSENAKLRRR